MIAERIKLLREKAELTQTQLAASLGITRSCVNAWELGISVPSTQYIIALAQYFEVSADYLLGIDKTATVSVAGLTQEDIALVYSLIDHLKSKK